MKRIFAILLQILCAVVALAQLPAPVALTVSVNTNGVLVAPTNFWAANSNGLNAVVASSGGGGGTTYRFNTNSFLAVGTNVSLAPTIYLTNDWTIDGALLRGFELGDITQLTLDGLDTDVSGVRTLFVDGGITTLRGRTNLQIITPAVNAQTAISGQVLTLTDPIEGKVEFQSAGAFNPTNLVLYGGAVTLPVGNTAARPASPANGMARYNSTTGRTEMYEAGAWYTPARVGEFDASYLSFATNQALTVGQVNQARANLRREDRSMLLIKGRNTWLITQTGRTSNVVTVRTDKAHGAITGQKFNTVFATNSMLNATEAVITVTGTNTFTYSQTGTNVPTATESTTDSYTMGWEVVNDSGHAPWGNPFIQSISASQITIAWDTTTAGAKVLSATMANHANSAQGRLWPVLNGVGANTVNVQLRFQETDSGRVWWTGTTTGGGITANANWTKEGDSTSASFVASTINALFIGHTGSKLLSLGSRGASTWSPPMVMANSGAIRPILPNFQVSPFTATAYQPASTGFYIQFVNSSGAIMDQTALEAITPASGLQVTWTRTVDTLVQDHTAVDSFPAFTMWLDVTFLLP